MTDLNWKTERGNVWNAETATDKYQIRPYDDGGWSMKTLELTVNGKPQDVGRVLNQTELKTLMNRASDHAELAPARAAVLAELQSNS
tara:strand:- start:451 stop:711 length:261 start_codon:yes stop_codon:yes gene_type:complete